MKKFFASIFIILQLILILLVGFYLFAPLPHHQQPKWLATSLGLYWQHVRKKPFIAPKLNDIYQEPISPFKHINLFNLPNASDFPLDFTYEKIRDDRIIYFDQKGKLSKKPDKNGYFRKVLGKTADGKWVLQDFYQNTGAAQVSAFILKKDGEMTNFDADQTEGIVAHFNPQGEITSLEYLKDQQNVIYHFENQKINMRSYSNNKQSLTVFVNPQNQILAILKLQEQPKAEYTFYQLYEPNGAFKFSLYRGQDMKYQVRTLWDKHGYAKQDHESPFPLSDIDKEFKASFQILNTYLKQD